MYIKNSDLLNVQTHKQYFVLNVYIMGVQKPNIYCV